MKRIDELNTGELEELREQLNKPITAEYRESFWSKTYHNETIGNPHKKAHYLLDKQFRSYHGLR